MQGTQGGLGGLQLGLGTSHAGGLKLGLGLGQQTTGKAVPLVLYVTWVYNNLWSTFQPGTIVGGIGGQSTASGLGLGLSTGTGTQLGTGKLSELDLISYCLEPCILCFTVS